MDPLILNRFAPPIRALALALATAAWAHASVWVSPSGDDGNPGTEEQPLRTITRARDIVRTLNRDMADDITVFIGGDYHVDKPVEFGPQDSGTNGFSIVYTAAPGEHPILSGGIRVVGWTVSDHSRNLWSAPVPAGLGDTRDLFVNGTPASRTKGRLLAVFTRNAADAGTAAPDPKAQWKNPRDVVFEANTADSIWSEKTGAAPAFVENAFELLGTPGEWYLDRPSRRIYYTPRPGEDMASADAVAATAEALVVGAGSAGRPLAGLIFKGIRFEYTTCLDPEAAPAAAVRFADAGGIQFLEDEFLHMGTPALGLGPGVDGVTIDGCVFADIARTALKVAGAARVRASESWFSYVATGHPKEGALEVERSTEVVIDHDQIDHFPLAAVVVAGESRPGAVREEANLVSAPMIGFHGAPQAPALPRPPDAGIPPAYRAIAQERFSSTTSPRPPVHVAAEAEDESAYVTWIPSCEDGGSPVTSYTVVSVGGEKTTVSAAAFQVKGYVAISGLDNGRSLSFTVSATNGVGTGPPSLPTASITPSHRRRTKTPAIPAGVSLTTGRAGSTIRITPPAFDGGSPVVSYYVDPGSAGAPVVVEGLDVIHADAAHPVRRDLAGFLPIPPATISVSATNALGDGKPAFVILK